MKRVLITGAAGFLGSHLSDRFIKEGYHVIGMDNLLTGNMANIMERELQLCQMAANTREAGNMINVMEREFKFIQTAANTREHGNVALCTERVLL